METEENKNDEEREVEENVEEEEQPKEDENNDDLELPEGIVVPPPPSVFGVGGPGDPRLIITHIVNENFKSYAGRQVLGPFHKSFTGIVGPNGSGKSNVIDSMLFVFGYRANKIRSKKLSVLIHNSENHKNCTSCTVEVHFEKIVDLDNGGYCTVPNSSFHVSRRATRDNSSQYFINGKKNQFRDVARLLQESGIDLNHNRFLILQGEVEQISLMKPKAVNEHGDGMLEYLEDIIGSSRYKEAIEKLSKEIEQLDEERKDKLSRVKLVEKDKEQLEPLRNEAVLFLRKENRVAMLNNQLLQICIRDVTKEAESFKEKLAEFDQEKKEIEEELRGRKEGRKSITKECAKLARLLEEANAKHLGKKEEMRELEKLNVSVFEDRKHRKIRLKELIKKQEKEEKKLKDLTGKPARLEEELQDLTEDRVELVKKKKEAEEKKSKVMETLLQDTKELQVEKEKLENVLLEKMKTVNELKQRWEVAEEETRLFVDNVTSREHAVEESKRKISDLDAKEQASSAELKKTKSDIPKMEKELNKSKASAAELRKTEARLDTEVRESQSSLAEARHSASSNKSKGAVVKFLAQLKKSGKVPGIHGRLGDLGGIDEKYDVAISSCCPSLENIVVDNIDTAQTCVQALKKNGVGQATFIALDKMSRHEQAARRSPNAPLPRLIDLVTPKEESFRVAFYHALRDTLVAENINSASSVAYGKSRRWRVVTLKGEVIDTSGTMSGGGNRVVRGRMGSTSAPDEMDPAQIERLQAKNAKVVEQLEKVKEDLSALEDQISRLEGDLHAAKAKVKSLEHEVARQSSVRQDLQRGLPELERRLQEAQPDPAKLAQLKKNAAKLKKDYEAVASDANEIDKQKDAIHFEICETNSSRLKPCQEALDDVTQKIDDVTKRLTKLKVGLTTAKRNREKCESGLTSLQAEIEENSQSIEELQNKWKQLEVDGARVLEELSVCESEDKSLGQDLREKQGALKRLEEDEGGLHEKMKKYKESTVAINAQYAAKMDQVKDHKESLSKLKLHVVDDDIADQEDGEVPELRTCTEEELECSRDGLKNQINIICHELSNMQPSMNAIQEYKEKQNIYLQRVGELDKVTERRDKYRGLHDQLRKNRLNDFSEGFSVITNKLKEIYQMITLGGDAELEFVDSLDPFSEGVVFSVRPPKKSWKNICNLSGGEKTLSSLALVFALHYYRPTPLYVMDEIDAALDFKNVSIIARYIIERTRNAQFIIISLRNNMFEVADRLVGIYKTDNCTKCATIEPALVSAA